MAVRISKIDGSKNHRKTKFLPQTIQLLWIKNVEFYS